MIQDVTRVAATRTLRQRSGQDTAPYPNPLIGKIAMGLTHWDRQKRFVRSFVMMASAAALCSAAVLDAA